MASTLFPQVGRVTEQRHTLREAALSNLGVQRTEDRPQRPQTSERLQDYYNLQDEIKDLDRQAAAIAGDRSLNADAKQEKLKPLRQQYQDAVKRFRGR